MKIIIYVEGGIVQYVRASEKEVEVILIDADNLLADGKTRHEINQACERLESSTFQVY